LAKFVNTNGSTTQKNFGANAQKINNTISEIKKYNQYFPVDFVVSICFKFLAKLRGDDLLPNYLLH